MNIVPRWDIDIKGRELASFDIPTRDNIYQYHGNNPFII